MTGRARNEYGTIDAQRARVELSRYIASKGLKQTRQRDLVVDAFFSAGSHLSVEELIQRVRRRDARVSSATVYRTMRLLCECGLASARHFHDEGGTLYEPAGDRHHHDHLICTRCHAIVEFDDESIEEAQRAIALRHGFEVHSHKHELYGLCARCSKQSGDVV